MASQIGAKLHAKLRTSSHFARLALLFEGMLGYGISNLARGALRDCWKNIIGT
jgi:hypothetical protein